MSVGRARLNVGDRVRVHPSGETGRIERVTHSRDGKLVYEVLFDRADRTASGETGETGGLYVAEDVEPA